MPAQGTGTALLRQTGIRAEQQAGQLFRMARKQLEQWLKQWTIPITSHRNLDKAIVTDGVVDLSEIDPRTMQSRRIWSQDLSENSI